MLPRNLAIEAFPPGLWRIDYFGGIRPSVLVRSEFQIAVAISPIVNSTINPLSRSAVDRNKQTIIFLATGLLPRLAIGTLWQDGLEAVIAAAYKERTFRIDTTDLTLYEPSQSFASPFDDNPEVPILNSTVAQFCAPVDDAHSRHLMVAVHEVGNKDTKQILIPAFEIMRFYACTHDVLARTLFTGEWPRLFRPHATYNLPNNSIEVGMSKVKGLVYNSAFILARYLLSEEMQNLVNGVHQSVQLSRARRAPLAIGSRFPFTGEASITIRYVGIPFSEKVNGKDETRWRQFGAQIVRCTHPFPFNECFPNPHWGPRQPTEAGDPNNTGELLPPEIRRAKRNPTGNENFIDDPSEPDNRVEPEKVEIMGDRFSFLTGKALIVLSKERKGDRKKRLLPNVDQAGTGLGTGEGVSGDTGTNPVTLSPGEDGVAEAVSLAKFIKAIRMLGASDNKYIVKTWAPAGVDLSKRVEGEFTIALKVLARGLGSQIERRSKWLQTGLNTTRHIVIAEVSVGGKFVYLLDLERKGSETFSVLGCATEDNSAISGKVFSHLAEAVVLKPGWPSIDELGADLDLGLLDFARSNHASDETVERFSERLRDKLVTRLLGKKLLGSPL